MVGVGWLAGWLSRNNKSVLTQFIMIAEKENNSLICRKQTWPPSAGGDADYKPVSGLDHTWDK